MNRLLRCKEAAEALGLKSSSMRVLERRGLISATRDWSGHRRFNERDVLELRNSLFSDGEKNPPEAA
jgi:DNA-binding transcriptional MerR regulator